MTTLTLEDVLPVAEKIVGEQPDFVYVQHTSNEGCTYVHNGQPDCLVARILSDLGWGVEDMARWDNEPGGASIGNVIETERLGADVGPGVMTFLHRLQVEQDLKHSWGDALESAKHSLKLEVGA